MNDERARLVEKAAKLLGLDTKPLLARLVECDGGEWYLREKIINTAYAEVMRDHTRPLRYAACFDAHGATVTFVKEGTLPTPDLEVTIGDLTFYMEVRKIRMGVCHHETREDCACTDAASKIVDLVIQKRAQLPMARIGFVAIDKFDLRKERGGKHESIYEGLRELERLAMSNPDGWRRPSGVIFSTCSIVSNGPELRNWPDFIWVNPQGECPPPDSLVERFLAFLPNASVFYPAGRVPAGQLQNSNTVCEKGRDYGF